jgi:hypothetical protein
MRACFALALAILSLAPVCGQERDAKEMVIVRPVEIDEVLVNPGMGIQTFQRFNGEAIYPTLDWSEAGPVERGAPVKTRPDFPASSVAYLRWFWSQIQPEPGQFRWDIIDTALDEARRHGQTLAMRLMPYDDRNPMPEWYRNSGAKRANAASNKDGSIWSPDASDPRYKQQWSALVKAAGARYDGHPYLDSVDVSTVGYGGEGWGPYLPDWPTQKALLDVYFEAFRRTPLLINFGSLQALA